MDKISFVYDEKGEYAPKKGLEFVKRKNIAAIIKYRNKYLLLDYKNLNYSKSLVTCGIEQDEDMIKAVTREVIEETGYIDIKSIEPVDCINISRFYVAHKKQNREATYYPFLVTLNSKERIDIKEEESREHDCIWIPEKDLDTTDIFENHKLMIDASK